MAGKETKLERDKVRSIQLAPAPVAKPAPPAVAKDAMAALRSTQSAAGPGAVHADYAQAASDAEFAVSPLPPRSGEKCPALKRVLSREEKAVAEENARQKARFDREVKAKEAEKAPPPPSKK